MQLQFFVYFDTPYRAVRTGGWIQTAKSASYSALDFVRFAGESTSVPPPKVPGDHWRYVKRTGVPVVPVRLGRAALCGASAIQSASCAGARRATAHVPGTAGGKIHKVGISGERIISLADRNPQEECAQPCSPFAALRLVGTRHAKGHILNTPSANASR